MDILKSCIIIPLIYLYTIVMASLSLLLSLVDRDGSLQHWCARTWCWLIAVTSGARMRVHGLENLPRDRACVVIANHQSYLDIPAIWANLPLHFRIMAKRVLFYMPFMGWFLWRAGHIPVDRDNARSALANVHRAIAKLQEGRSIVIFPEGSRSVDATLQDFKSGGFKIALKAGAPIIPVTIIGTCRVLKKDSLIFHAGDVDIYVDAPIETSEYNNRNLPELIARTRNCIAGRLAQSPTSQHPHPSFQRDRRDQQALAD